MQTAFLDHNISDRKRGKTEWTQEVVAAHQQAEVAPGSSRLRARRSPFADLPATCLTS